MLETIDWERFRFGVLLVEAPCAGEVSDSRSVGPVLKRRGYVYAARQGGALVIQLLRVPLAHVVPRSCETSTRLVASGEAEGFPPGLEPLLAESTHGARAMPRPPHVTECRASRDERHLHRPKAAVGSGGARAAAKRLPGQGNPAHLWLPE